RKDRRREENDRREEREKLEERKKEKKTGEKEAGKKVKNKISQIAEIAEMTIEEGHGHLKEGIKGGRGRRREENDKKEESEELEKRKIEKKTGEKEAEKKIKNKIGQITEIAEIIIAEETDVVYAICQIKDCTRKYAHHGSTTNYTKHLRDDHHITEASLSSKTPEEISNLKQPKK
ncbi:10277_t:CDS:2, partial [Dentiscutata erythropus]